ncbi:hypothetical protein STAS_21587 [Striga asiatica]|uniref:DUF868 family protein n=1 Tax=Striga asiatica TaxID=4170 RepID=A0A5A7QH89_STRAF|nr:hypothetical protein STAS_21587 [Striga asiatica]
MRDFPSCFGENGVQVADASCSSIPTNRTPQNSVSCTYKCKILSKPCFITIIWGKNLMGQCLSIEIDDASHKCLCKFDVKPSLFSKRKGSKSLDVNSSKIEVFWDLSLAKFGPGPGPEPIEGYYISILFNKEMVLLVGDLKKEAFKKTGAIAPFSSATFISKKQNVFGKKIFCTKAQFCNNGPTHEVRIECDPNCEEEPSLTIRIDSKPVMQIKRLNWKFRGNCTILVDGLPVEVFWDVHNWLFGPNLGGAVFLFQSSLSAEKMWAEGQSVNESPVVKWSYLGSFREGADLPGLAFSFFLYAWRNE